MAAAQPEEQVARALAAADRVLAKSRLAGGQVLVRVPAGLALPVAAHTSARRALARWRRVRLALSEP